MLIVKVGAAEFYDERTGEFKTTKPVELRMEHSLVSMSKWESRWRKPFISKAGLTAEELVDYFRCMTLTQNVDPLVYSSITKEVAEQIVEYINSDLSATTIDEPKGPRSQQRITTELIYFWMFSYGIPIECQKWPFSRLIKLLQIASIKNSSGGRKMSANEIRARNRALNEARRAKLHTKG